VLVVGDGPAREWFAERLPGAVFAGFQEGADLAAARAALQQALLRIRVAERRQHEGRRRRG